MILNRDQVDKKNILEISTIKQILLDINSYIINREKII
jgi:hypothetical protein